MIKSSFVRSAALAGSAVTLAALAPSVTAATTSLLPRVATRGVNHVRGNSAVMEGSVNPNGSATTYFFQYGPTTAYGRQTPQAAVPTGTKSVKVAQTVIGLAAGYHYRIVASNAAGPAVGRDRVFTATVTRLKFAMESSKQSPTPYGGTFILRGTLTGGPLQLVTAQSSPFPFLSPFVDIGTPVLTNAAGTFAIAVPNLRQSTQLRTRTSGTRPLLGSIVTAHVSPRVTLKVRSSSRKGLVRLYGTVTPANVGATVLFQVEKAVRPRAKSEEETERRFVTQARTRVKRATRTFSRFSQVLTLRKSGRYRAYVVLHSGALVSGASAATPTLHAAPTARNGK